MNRLLVILFCFQSFNLEAQINRVYNPSFEQISQCPNSNWQAYYADGWSGLDTSYFGAGQNCNPYLLNSCSSNFGIPSAYNGYFYQYPRTGSSIMLYQNYFYDSISNTEARSFVHGKLLPLQTNVNYCIKLYFVSNNSSTYGTNMQSIYLDNGTVCSNDSCLTPRNWVIPQLVNQTIIIDTLNWQKIEGAFTATGNERFINIGNFASHSQTQVLIVGSNLSEQTSDYFIDDVSVVDHNLPAFAGTDALIATGDSVYLGRPNEIGPECRWWANGTALNDSSLGFWAKPTQPTQYVLQQKICGNIKYDTVFVNIGHVGFNPLSTEEPVEVKLIPNPSNGSFSIKGNFSNIENVSYEVNGIDGKQVKIGRLDFTNGIADLNMELSEGVYNLKIVSFKQTTIKKMVIVSE